MDERLAQLARRHGIALAYEDVWGVRREAPAATLVALLAALGADAGGGVAVDDASADAGGEVLPPVLVLYDDQAVWCVPVAVPDPLRAVAVQWQVQTEFGELRQGQFVAAELPASERGGATLSIAGALPAGYHRLRLSHDGEPLAETMLIAAPRHCYVPAVLADGGRVWGLTAQLYALRSTRNWGIGDFTDLCRLVELAAEQGAALVGVNPLHALYPHDPERASPYGPSSRLFLNTLYIDVEAVEDFAECEEARTRVHSAAFQQRLSGLRATDLVDYAGVAAAKREVLDLLFAHFRRAHLGAGSARAAAFAAWRTGRGAALAHHTLFEALQEHLHAADPHCWGWPAWPPQYRSPDSPAVAGFNRAHADRVDYFVYLQWLADQQLAAVARRAEELALGVGLYADLAVSVDCGGAEVWSNATAFAPGVSIGAPPDAFNLLGQDWGLPPLSPRRLREAAYAPVVAILRACMAHAGALRIDHVMALFRLYWIPAGGKAADGAYVHYPFDDLMAIVTLESQRNHCVVIGEDLGTVPGEVREKLVAAGALSYRVLYFERDPDGEFIAPARYPAQALVAVSTHDLPPLTGWWAGTDLRLRDALGLYPSTAERDHQTLERTRDRARLLRALEREALLPAGATVDPDSVPQLTDAMLLAVHELIARSPAAIAVVQLEDILGTIDPVNVPGTTDQHPNWRRKLPARDVPLTREPRLLQIAQAFSQQRPRRSPSAGPLRAVVPRATYRVQLHRDFRFEDARAIVPYLARLGVSHLYCSPFLQARPGSLHGYDIIDHGRFNAEIGSGDDFERLVAALNDHGMGLLADVVPNHMGVLGGDNPWWMDVLENGQASEFACFFDIDWTPSDPALAGRVLLPLLGEQYGSTLEAGRLQLAFEAATGAFVLRYHEHRLPLDPATYPLVLETALATASAGALDDATRVLLAGLASAFRRLPARDRTEPAARAERNRDKEVHKAALGRSARGHSAVRDALNAALAALNGTVGDPRSFDALDRLIDAQVYRLAFWRVAGDQINYRRFFDINDLAALRMEDPVVFEATHRLVFELAGAGKLQGLRIDHPDGLLDPQAYFERLQRTYARRMGAAQTAVDRPLYVVAEKIVAPHEQLPRDWAVFGTTGYRFCNLVTGLLIDGAARARLDRTWRAFVGADAQDFEDLAYAGRRLVMETSLAGELGVLSGALRRIARADRHTRDFTLNALRRALADVVASFPVYRTYIIDAPSASDRRYIDWAVGRARRRSQAADASALEFIRHVLLGETPTGAAADLRDHYLAFTRRLQQFTAPVMAKGVEDTALYRHHRLVALNEVGGDPDTFGIGVSAFHGASRDRAAHWPHTMLATSTHDTKRSEDVRARLAVISEMPAAWRLSVRRWSRMNRSHRREYNGAAAPSRNDEYLLYQTLLGTLPLQPLDNGALAAYRERIDAYMRKAVREAKQHSSWITPDADYEAALAGFIDGLLGRAQGNLFLDDLRQTVAQVAWYGALNTLTMTALKLVSPGVPDLFQGQEMINLSLVDPDNRRAVDYEARAQALARLAPLAESTDRAAALSELLASFDDGRAKLWLTWRALQLRREHPSLFERGDYLPLAVQGPREDHALAFARRHDGQVVVVVAGRLFAALTAATGSSVAETLKRVPSPAAWADTGLCLDGLPTGLALRDVLSGAVHQSGNGNLPIARLLAHWPVAVLHATNKADDSVGSQAA